MFEKLQSIKTKYDELTIKLADPQIIANNNLWTKLVKEHSSMQPVVEAYESWIQKTEQLDSTLEMVHTESDVEMQQMIQAEISQLKDQIEALEHQIKVLLLPIDPNDAKNVIIEIRCGAGGEEAALFAQEVRRMYYMYAEKNRLRIEEIYIYETELGGLKEASFSVIGNNAYSKFKWESGVHRVQRVPETESQGRIHTSTITVAVLPEVEDIDVTIEDRDLKVDTYRSSGAGGQHINKTESAIRITHIPTGIIVACQEERSQVKNRDKAMKMLKSKLYNLYQTQADKELSQKRKAQVGTGDRSERIRTYNYPQGRVTDHRIGFTVYTLTEYLNGDIDEMIEALTIADQTAKLQSLDD